MSATILRAVSYVCLTFLVLAACSADKSREEPGAPAGASPRTVVAAGDIADCDTDGDADTARLAGRVDGTVLALGDNA